ncbi:MAG: phospholipase superfamily protein [Fibrobacteres bacterium]|nr:phospholipase superfamily protein [Fibrobacterota bacterium]
MRLLFPILFLPIALMADPAQRLAENLHGESLDLLAAHPGQSAAVTLERGELSLLSRAWLADHAARTLDVQYFIWTADNVGRLAMASLLDAADRGVKVRVLVDDFLLETPAEMLTAMDGHPNFEIRIYNPNTNTGVGFWRRYWNLATGFRAVNQRMHNKALIVDGMFAVTGGRNLADEYFDFHHEFDFRDRDLLVGGPVVDQMDSTFDTYWNAPLARPVKDLLPPLDQARQQAVRDSIHAYALDSSNFDPAARLALKNIPETFGALLQELAWGPARFVADAPGKNDGKQGLAGGGATTRFLADLLRSARKRITIQSPYLIPDDSTLALFKALTARGVEVRISTNSMANNDNLKAVSGYINRRKALLAAGVKVFEFKPQPGIQKNLQQRYGKFKKLQPIFVIHAKTLVVDGNKVFIGTFNLDPRSMNLNTESGVLLEHAGIAGQVERAIERDMEPENSWDASKETGDSHAPLSRRIKTWFWGRLPIESVL